MLLTDWIALHCQKVINQSGLISITSIEEITITQSESYQTPLSVLPQKTKTEQIREGSAVMPSELQSLPSLTG
jgi:hypothetical protein